MGKTEGLLAKIRKIRRDQWIVLLLAGILVIIVSFPAPVSEKNAADTEKQDARPDGAQTLEEMEARLEEILSRLDGAGSVRVMITQKDSGEKIVEKDTPTVRRTTQENQGGGTGSSTEEERQEATVFEKNGSGYESPYVARELMPRTEGVLVLAEGADNAVVKKEITDAVMALFDLEAHKIKVMKMHERRG